VSHRELVKGFKTAVAQAIVNEIPEHKVFVQPCIGSYDVLSLKPPSLREIVSDTNLHAAHFFRDLRDNTSIARELRRHGFDSLAFDASKIPIDKVCRAALDLRDPYPFAARLKLCQFVHNRSESVLIDAHVLDEHCVLYLDLRFTPLEIDFSGRAKASIIVRSDFIRKYKGLRTCTVGKEHLYFNF